MKDSNKQTNNKHIIKKKSCIQGRQPAPDPHGSHTGSLLSVIRWHLNLPLNLALTLL